MGFVTLSGSELQRIFIDDATSKLMQLRFVLSESTDSYFGARDGDLTTHGCPTAFYSDKHTVFRVNRTDAKGGSGMTQFGHALAELNIKIRCANLRQAEGRVERAHRTLQDRPVKELRLSDICDIAGGNAFVPGFMEHFNEKFSLPAAKTENKHRKLNVQASRLADILCHREQHHVSQQLSLAYDRRQIILERMRWQTSCQANTSMSTTSPTGRLRCAGNGTHFPIGSQQRPERHPTAIIENKLSSGLRKGWPKSMYRTRFFFCSTTMPKDSRETIEAHPSKEHARLLVAALTYRNR